MKPGDARAAWAAAVLVGAIGIAAVVTMARARSSAPARCPDGMIALGPRCCGEGQALGAEQRCEGVPTRCAPPLAPSPSGCVAAPNVVDIAGGELKIGPGDWDALGLVSPRLVRVASFRIDAFETSEAAWSTCVAAAKCPAGPLGGGAGRAITSVTVDESRAFCAWKGGDLPVVDQWIFAAAGPRNRRYPWGETGAVCRRAAFSLKDGPCSEGARGPELVGAHPDGKTPEGVFDWPEM